MNNEIPVYSLDTSTKFRKSVIILKHDGNMAYPVAYISKPKHTSEEEFNKIIKLIWTPTNE